MPCLPASPGLNVLQLLELLGVQVLHRWAVTFGEQRQPQICRAPWRCPACAAASLLFLAGDDIVNGFLMLRHCFLVLGCARARVLFIRFTLLVFLGILFKSRITFCEKIYPRCYFLLFLVVVTRSSLSLIGIVQVCTLRTARICAVPTARLSPVRSAAEVAFQSRNSSFGEQAFCSRRPFVWSICEASAPPDLCQLCLRYCAYAARSAPSPLEGQRQAIVSTITGPLCAR